MLEILFFIYLLIGAAVFAVDLLVHVDTWITEKMSFVLFMYVVFMYVVFIFLWPLAVWDYARCALRKWKGGIRG